MKSLSKSKSSMQFNNYKKIDIPNNSISVA